MTAPVEVVPVEASPREVHPGPPGPAPSLRQRLTGKSARRGWANLLLVLGVTLVALSQLHPSLLLANTTTAGGDTGAHVILPAFMRSHLLTHGQLTGWDPGWYDGFPVYTFYFPLPGLITVVFNSVLSYDVAFKLVTVLGTLLLPTCAWAFGRLARLRDPAPACLAAATLPFLFEPSFSIYGGNLLSTLAGEFSFSLSLSFALLFLGLVASGLRTGRHRALAAVLFAVTLLCHLIPALFALVGAGVWLLLDADTARGIRRGVRGRLARRRWSRRLAWSVVAGAVGIGLTAWWLIPFALGQAYTTDMGYTKVLGFPHLLFPASARWVLAADLVGVVAMVYRRNRVALFLVIMGGISAAVVCLDPTPKLYNVRFLPLWFLCAYLMAGYALSEVVAAVARWNRRRRLDHWVQVIRERLSLVQSLPWRPGDRVSRFRRPTPDSNPPGSVVGPLIALAAACLVVVPPLALPPSTLSHIGITVGANQPSAWANWNYSGYERKPDYPEYRAVIQMMAKVGTDQGCGRSMWEYDPSLNRFGTTMALMLLPYWTNGCVDSMEGLLFESASTTPFHFINQNELSVTPSDAVVGLPYGGLNVPLGIEHLQQLGVRYLLASSTTVEQAAAADPNVTQVASTGPWSTSYNGQALATTWKVYKIKDSSLVQPLANQPVVWKGVSPGQTSWLAPAVSWYDAPGRWSVVPAADGPSAWARVPVGDQQPTARSEPNTTVSSVSQTDNAISFHVDRVGTPVEVKVSYFPNWQASGANGPWRVAPNLMVVVPTSHDVTLHYASSGADRLGELITLLAVVAVVALVVVDRRTRRARWIHNPPATR
jgi:6-pyruvoyl-tetrahydropterin synthase related domain